MAISSEIQDLFGFKWFTFTRWYDLRHSKYTYNTLILFNQFPKFTTLCIFSSAFVNQHYNSEFNEHLFLFHKNKTRLKSRIIYKPLFGCSNKQKPQKSSLLKCLDVFANRIKWMILRNLRKEKIHSIHCMSSKYNEFTILFNS